MSKLQILTGRIARPQKAVVFGPEGIGKSTLAAQFPAPVFLDTEGGTHHLDVARLPAPKSWDDVTKAVTALATEAHEFKTLVLDTVEQLFKPIDGIENERLEFVRFRSEDGDCRDDIGPRPRCGKSSHVEVVCAALGVEKDGRRELCGERGLADAFGTEDHGFLWPGDAPGEDLEFGHDGLRFVPRELDVPPAPNGAALPEAKTSGVSRCARLP